MTMMIMNRLFYWTILDDLLLLTNDHLVYADILKVQVSINDGHHSLVLAEHA